MISSHNVIASFEWFSISYSIYISIWCAQAPAHWYGHSRTYITQCSSLIPSAERRHTRWHCKYSARESERTMTVILCFNLILFDVACRILVIFIVKIEFRSTWITIVRSLALYRRLLLWMCVHLRVEYDLLNSKYNIVCAMRFTGW